MTQFAGIFMFRRLLLCCSLMGTLTIALVVAATAVAEESPCISPVMHYGWAEAPSSSLPASSHWLHHMGVTIRTSPTGHFNWRMTAGGTVPTEISLLGANQADQGKQREADFLRPSPWPRPLLRKVLERVDADGREDAHFEYVYEHQALLPILLETAGPSLDHLRIHLEYSVCDRLCAICRYTLPLRGLTPSAGDRSKIEAEIPQLAHHEEEELYQKVQIGEALPPTLIASLGILWVLSAAFLGGLCLNCMPCVLPVLAIKFMGVIRSDAYTPSEIRKESFASFLGIMTTYLALAIFFASLKSAGMLVGLGMHFQEPIFLFVMSAITLLFALNLFGLFEIFLPTPLVSLIERVDQRVLGYGKHYFNGVLACLLSTPCSAPFVGSAAGVALSRDIPLLFLIFATMGCGMGTPYLVAIFRPSLLSYLPKPGRWMVQLRIIMGVSLLLTSLWLLFVGTSHYREMQPMAKGPTTQSGEWELAFSPEALASELAQGNSVIVEIGAVWCVTCQVNHHMVWNRPGLRRFLEAHHVVLMHGDFTRYVPLIAEFMAKYERHSVPTTILFTPSFPRGVVLDELLTPGLVKKAVRQHTK